MTATALTQPAATAYPPLVDPGAPLTAAQARRYSRHLLLPQLGELGQRRLLAAKVLVVGAGGLGSPALLYLAAAGVGTLGVVDDDVVEESNLQRQVIHGVEDVGRSKVDSAREAVARIDPALTVRTHAERLTADNVLELVEGYDLVLDGSDNFATRYLVADACEILGKPSVWGTILRFEGQVSVSWPGRGATYRDLFPDPPDPASVPSCAGAGVLGVMCAAIGAAMGAEAVKLIAGIGRPLVDRLLVHDALAATWRELATSPDPDRQPATTVEQVDPVCSVPAPARPPGSELSVEEVQDLLGRRSRGEIELEVLDVREPQEFAGGSIDGARLVPKGEILSGRAELPADRPVLLYCAAGGRSGEVLDHLLASGRSDVRHLIGGYGAWLTRDQ